MGMEMVKVVWLASDGIISRVMEDHGIFACEVKFGEEVELPRPVIDGLPKGSCKEPVKRKQEVRGYASSRVHEKKERN